METKCYLFLLALSLCTDTYASYSAVAPVNFGRPLLINATTIRHRCYLQPTDENTHTNILDLLDRGTKLIKYKLSVQNHTQNPLTSNITWSYKPEQWARTSTQHGQTLLSLAFNYGVLSLMTLTVGVETVNVEMKDVPFGCMSYLSEEAKMESILDLTLRDFKPNGKYLTGEETVCHQIIQGHYGYAQFVNLCCQQSLYTAKGMIQCTTDINNVWVTILNGLLKLIKSAIVLFGPLLLSSWLFNRAIDPVKYLVKLKEPIYKKIFVSNNANGTIQAKRTLDLRKGPIFKQCLKQLVDVPKEQIVPAKITEYRIWVDYNELLTENKVPVGLLTFLRKFLFFCKMGNTDPCRPCCTSDMLPQWKGTKYQWISFCQFIGKILVIMCTPFLVYLHIFVYYKWENTEVINRKQLIHNLGLKEVFNFRLFHYLLPSHPLFIVIYITYYVISLSVAIMATFQSKKGKFERHIQKAFRDLARLSYINTFSLVISVFLWPLKKHGVLGILVGLVFWPVALPITTLVALSYLFPLVYMTFRLIFWPKKKYKEKRRGEGSFARIGLYGRFVRWVHSWLEELEVARLLSAISSPSEADSDDEEEEEENEDELEGIRILTAYPSLARVRKIVLYLIASFISVFSLYAAVIMMAECIGFIVEGCVFTLMGVIVNAGTILRYVTLVILVALYSYDCYNNVAKKYLQLNKALFSEIKGKIKDLEEVTRLPSHLQENRGFKACENSEQEEFEIADDIHEDRPRHFFINDLILFVDKEDKPRIPLELFEKICNIRVSGSPGPVWRSLLVATKDFMTMVVLLWFVFLVVASFGSAYKMSSGNQTMATLAGGFLPFLLRSLFKPTPADVEIHTVSFRSKLDEIVTTFNQPWPMHDFPFEMADEDDGQHTPDTPDSEPVVKDNISHNFTTNNNESESVFDCPFPLGYGDETIFLETRERVHSQRTRTESERVVRNNIPRPRKENIKGNENECDEVDLLIYIPHRRMKQSSRLNLQLEVNEEKISLTDSVV